MHAKTKITDLSLRQWDYLQDNVEHRHQFKAGEVRVCVEFELTPDMSSIHVELPIVDLAGLLTVLQGIEQAAQAEAILSDAEQIVGRVVEENQPQGGRFRQTDPARSYDESYRCEHHNPPHFYDCRA